MRDIVNTRLFKLKVAQTGYGWLQDLHAMTVREVRIVDRDPHHLTRRQVNGRNVLTPKPETEEYNVQSFIYSRRRPFHPRRLFALLHDKFILQMEHPDDDGNDEEGSTATDVQLPAHDDASASSTSGPAGKGPSATSPPSSPSTAQTVPSPKGSLSGLGDQSPAGSARQPLRELDPMDIPPAT